MTEEELVDTIKEIIEASHKDSHKLMVMLIERHEESAHHQFVKVEIEREARRQEMWDRLKGNLLFWALTGVTAAIGLALWAHFVEKS